MKMNFCAGSSDSTKSQTEPLASLLASVKGRRDPKQARSQVAQWDAVIDAANCQGPGFLTE